MDVFKQTDLHLKYLEALCMNGWRNYTNGEREGEGGGGGRRRRGKGGGGRGEGGGGGGGALCMSTLEHNYSHKLIINQHNYYGKN